MDQAPYSLDETRRDAVLKTIQEVCVYRGWTLVAAHVRTNHVHLVVDCAADADLAMGSFKAYASRRLNSLGLDEPQRKRWARHGSTRWLWTPEQVAQAVEYVVHGQGDAMAVFMGDFVC